MSRLIYHQNRGAPVRTNWFERGQTKTRPELMQLRGSPQLTEDEKQLPFKDKIASFFIRHGSYRITKNSENLPTVQEAIGLHATTISRETLESASSKDNSDFIEGLTSTSTKRKKELIASVVWDLVEQGKWQELLESSAIKPRAFNGYWSAAPNRIFWIRELVSSLNKCPQNLSAEDFINNRLHGLLADNYKWSPFLAVSEAYPELGIKAWEMLVTPLNFFDNKKNRIDAVKWLARKLAKDPRNLTHEDFANNRLIGLFHFYGDSPFLAISEAYPKLGINAWEMIQTPRDLFDKKENRIAAVKWLAEKLAKDPRDLINEDFVNNRLPGLIDFYRRSTFLAVSEAYPELAIKAWEMHKTQAGFFDSIQNRIASVKWLAEKLVKNPRNLTQDDFANNRLAGLLQSHYSGSPFMAVSEAYPEIKSEEMARKPRKNMQE